MPALSVLISRFVDEHFPGLVACELIDAKGELHRFVEKVPIVTQASLSLSSSYPQSGEIACTLEAEWKDEEGRALVRVSTKLPYHVESTEGECRFVVLSSQVQP